MTARLVAWADLSDGVRQEVRRAFVHWQYDTTSKTFEEWAAKHAFYVTRRNRLALKPHHCEPAFLAAARIEGKEGPK